MGTLSTEPYIDWPAAPADPDSLVAVSHSRCCTSAPCLRPATGSAAATDELRHQGRAQRRRRALPGPLPDVQELRP